MLCSCPSLAPHLPLTCNNNLRSRAASGQTYAIPNKKIKNPLMKLNQCRNTNTLTHKHSDFTQHSARGHDIPSCSDGIGKHNEQNATAQSSIMIVHSDSTNISNDKKGSARATSSMAGQPPWQQGVPTTSCIYSFVFSTDTMDALDALR